MVSALAEDFGANTDHVASGITDDGHFRVMACRTTLLVEEARRRHGMSPTATAALGRGLTASVLMAATLDEGQAVTLRFVGDGPIGGLIVEGRNNGESIDTRGYASDPAADLPPKAPGKLDVGGLVGKNGFLYVTKDLGLKEMYTGSSALQSGEIGIDVAYYYTVSEQLPSAVSVGVRLGGGTWVSGAGGIMVQAMPGLDAASQVEVTDRIQKNLLDMGSVSFHLRDGVTPLQLIEAVFQGIGPVRILRLVPVGFKCKCSRERAISTLSTLGKEDLQKLAGERESVDVRCHFCNEVYIFSGQELSAIADSLQHN